MDPSPSRSTVPDCEAQEIAHIAAFLSGASFGATHPARAELERGASHLAPGAELYLTAVPGRPAAEMIATAIEARALGFRPTPHIGARDFASLSALRSFLDQAQADSILLVGGDRPTPAGVVPDALTVLESGVLQDAGIVRVGLPGFPDGHPLLDEEELELALLTKLAAAQRAGLEAHVATQFCADARPIESWLIRLRARGVHTPVRIGFAAPINLMQWLAYARRCGVRASAEALASQSGLSHHAFREIAPDAQIRSAARWTSGRRLGAVTAHFFAFAGLGAAGRWVEPAAHGQIVLKGAGFEARSASSTAL